MAGPSIEIRSATVGEMPQAVSTIVAAFITDPIVRFALLSPHDYLRVMPLATREFAGGSFEHGTAYVSTDFRGAANLDRRSGHRPTRQSPLARRVRAGQRAREKRDKGAKVPVLLAA